MISAPEYHVAGNPPAMKLDSDVAAIVVFPDRPEIPVVEKHERCFSRIGVGLDEIEESSLGLGPERDSVCLSVFSQRRDSLPV